MPNRFIHECIYSLIYGYTLLAEYSNVHELF